LKASAFRCDIRYSSQFRVNIHSCCSWIQMRATTRSSNREVVESARRVNLRRASRNNYQRSTRRSDLAQESHSTNDEENRSQERSRREYLFLIGSSVAFARMFSMNASASYASSSASSSAAVEEYAASYEDTIDADNDMNESDESSVLMKYEDDKNNFEIKVPKEWVKIEKAGAQALFKNPLVKYQTIGITVMPVRIKTLREFGSVEEIGRKLIEAEGQKQTTVPGGTFMLNERERESYKTKTVFYEYEYRLITTHGDKRVYNYVGVRDDMLFIVNAQAYEVETGGEGVVDRKTMELYREVGRSFDVLRV
jgi:hypothetical protein